MWNIETLLMVLGVMVLATIALVIMGRRVQPHQYEDEQLTHEQDPDPDRRKH